MNLETLVTCIITFLMGNAIGAVYFSWKRGDTSLWQFRIITGLATAVAVSAIILNIYTS